MAYAGLAWLQPDFVAAQPALLPVLGMTVSLAGLAGIVCGVMVYHVVRRPFWHAGRSTTKFLGTAAVLGLATTWMCSALNWAWWDDGLSSQSLDLVRTLCPLLAGVAAAKLLYEAAHFRHLCQRRFTPLRRTAQLMVATLKRATIARFALGLVGGVVVPLLACTADERTSAGLAAFGAALSFVSLLTGEIAERYLFFTAVVRQKMPGGLAV
jgi:DMSO reductase anchor subunit